MDTSSSTYDQKPSSGSPQESLTEKNEWPTCVHKNASTLTFMLLGENPYQHVILKNAAEDLTKTLVEITHNCLYGTIPLTEQEKQALATEKPLIKRYLKAKNKRLFLARHYRKILPLILPPVLKQYYLQYEQHSQIPFGNGPAMEHDNE